MAQDFTTIRQLFRELLITDVAVEQSGIYVDGNYFTELDEIPAGTLDQVRSWMLETLDYLEQQRVQKLPHGHIFYRHRYLDTYYPCTICKRPTQDACPECNKPHCFQCRYNLNASYLRPEAEEPYLSLCLEDYRTLTNRTPDVWGWPNRPYAWVHLPLEAIEKGTSTPASDVDSWVSDPEAANVITFFPTDHTRTMDTFSLLSFSHWLAAQQDRLAPLVKQTSDALTAYHRRMQARAQRADAGIIDYSQYE